MKTLNESSVREIIRKRAYYREDAMNKLDVILKENALAYREYLSSIGIKRNERIRLWNDNDELIGEYVVGAVSYEGTNRFVPFLELYEIKKDGEISIKPSRNIYFNEINRIEIL